MDKMMHDLSIRIALPEDRDDILRWRNDPDVCAMSVNTDPVPEDAHHQWYAHTLTKPDRLLLIGMAGNSKAGFVRFDHHGNHLWEISIVIAPTMRGQKIGQQLLQMGMKYMESHCAPQNFSATVHPSNHASLKLFESLKFRRKGRHGAFITLIRPSIVD